MGYVDRHEVTVRLEEHTCQRCGIVFAVPESFHRRYRENGQSMRCPNPLCDWDSFRVIESEVAAAKAEAERQKKRAERAEFMKQHYQRSAAAYKGQTTKLRKRAAAGVCPCCNRQFQNLRRHMETKHPDFGSTDA